MALDIGAPAIGRPTFVPANFTYIMADNRANISLAIEKVVIWAETNLTACKVGSFYGTALKFTCRDSAVIGAVASGAPRTSSVDIDCEEGDLIGIYYTAGELSSDVLIGGGVYRKPGDQFAAGLQTYNYLIGFVASLFGRSAVKWDFFTWK